MKALYTHIKLIKSTTVHTGHTDNVLRKVDNITLCGISALYCGSKNLDYRLRGFITTHKDVTCLRCLAILNKV